MMKFKTLIILALSLLLLVTLAIPVSAARPTEKIKYPHRSDGSIMSNGTPSYVDTTYLGFGDRDQYDQKYRAFYKFALGGIKVSNIDWVELELHISSVTIDDGYHGGTTMPNIQTLGDALIVPIDDYGRRLSGTATYNSDNISAPIVLIPASNTTVTTPLSANVTDAVIAAKTAKSRFVTFSVQTALENDNDDLIDMWWFHTSEADSANRPRLIVHLKQ